MCKVQAGISVFEFRQAALLNKGMEYLDLLRFIGQLIEENKKFYSVGYNQDDGSTEIAVYWKSNIVPEGFRHVLSVLRRKEGDYYLLIYPHWSDAFDTIALRNN